MTIEQIIDRVYPVPAAARHQLTTAFQPIRYPKGHLLMKAGKVEPDIYFISRGIVRAFVYQHNHKITFWFGSEGDTVLSMRSYVERQPGYEHIELLEDCLLYRLSTNDLEVLFRENIQIANWGRKLAERELIKTEERLISRQFSTATERYKALLEEHPDLVKRVQLGHIASYLGITQVSLSRIRAEFR